MLNDLPIVNPRPTKRKIISKECRFVTYVPAPSHDQPDLHTVKELIYYDDGTTEPNLHFLYDYKRPVWVAKKGIRKTHKQHKEWELIENLDEYQTTEKDMIQTLARALGMPWFKQDKRKLFENPYIYGADIKSTAVIKKGYMDKYKAEITKFSVCAFDIETDVVRGDEQTIMATLSYKEKVFSVVTKIAVEGIIDVPGKMEKISRKYLGEYFDKRNITAEVLVVENEMELYIAIFKKAHEWKPDFLAIWNMDFEITEIMKACDRWGYDIRYLFSDPAVPDAYKYFDYVRGKPSRKTSSGKEMPVRPAARWHTVTAPATFYVIDGMCAFKHTRMGEPERQSYGYDEILMEEFEGKVGKLKIEEASHLKAASLPWHKFMQEKYPLEYLAYNQFDSIGQEVLDDKVMDLAVLIQKFSGTSDFADFKSQPRRSADALHWFVKDRGRIMGVTSSAIVDEFDDDTLGREDWIITLPAELIADGGLQILEEGGWHRTTIYGHVGDLDVSASYPNGEVCFNISKETTSRELESIEGIEEEVFRLQNMGLSAGHVNAVDYCVQMMGFPRLEDLVTMFRNQKSMEAQQGAGTQPAPH